VTLAFFTQRLNGSAELRLLTVDFADSIPAERTVEFFILCAFSESPATPGISGRFGAMKRQLLTN